MYFELLNVNVQGTYLVEKVSHHIEAGEMTAHIVGVRMANTTAKLRRSWFGQLIHAELVVAMVNLENQLADVTNDCLTLLIHQEAQVVELWWFTCKIHVNDISTLINNEAGGEGWLTHGATSKTLKGKNTNNRSGQHVMHGRQK